MQQYESTIRNLKEKYGEDINWSIVWMLALEDKFSDPATDIEKEYDNKVIEWKLEIANKNELSEIEKRLEMNSAQQGRLSSE